MAKTKEEKSVPVLLQEWTPKLQGYKLRNYDMTPFVRSAKLAIERTPELSAIMATPEGQNSMYDAMCYASTTGLSLNPQEGKAALIPYNTKVNGGWVKTINYQIMKNGLCDLAISTGKVSKIEAHVVKKGDDFKIRKTSDGDNYDWAPAITNRGETVGAFCAVKIKKGGNQLYWMTTEEIEEHRKKYSKNAFGKNGEPNMSSPWFKSFDGMAEKTVTKMLLKKLYLDDNLNEVINNDNMIERGIIDVTPKGSPEMKPMPSVDQDKKGSNADDVKSMLGGSDSAI
jgi:recombination protein RecT